MVSKAQEKLKQAGFSPDQISEIMEGAQAGIDVSVYADKELFAIQMRQIRLGLQEGLPVELYASREYDWFQMEEIRKGLQSGIDVKKYADPKLSYDRMRQIRKGLERGVDLWDYRKLDAGLLRQLRKAILEKVNIVEFIRQGYDAEQLEQIRLALAEGLDIVPYLQKEFRGAAIQEIRTGLAHGVDVSVYARIELGWRKMRELRLGLEHRVDVEYYSNPLYSWQQMRELRLGLEEGLDVTRYRSFVHTAAEMKKLREQLMEQEDGWTEDDQRNMDREVQGGLDESKEQSEFLVSVSQDEMEAYVYVCGDCTKLTELDVVRALNKEGVVQGILYDEVRAMIAGNYENQSVRIAQGERGKTGEDGWYEFFFRTSVQRKPEILPDGSVNYQSIDWFELVEQGQRIAYYHEAKAGSCGQTVTGKPVEGRKGREQNVLTGKGFMVMPDKKTYLANVTGRIELTDHNIEISRLLVVEEATLATGNVSFDGSVYIKGNVGSGVTVTATEDVVVAGFVEAAVIRAGGSVTLCQGMNGSGSGSVTAEKDIQGKFFESARLRAEENIHANYCLNSELYAGREIVVSGNEGVIAGGSAYAGRVLNVYDAGNHVGLPTFVRLGTNEQILAKQQEIETREAEILKEMNILGNAYLEMNRKYAPEIRNTMDLYLKVENAIYTKEREMEKVTKDKLQLEEIMKNIHDAEAVIRGTVYEGTVLEINGSRWTARSSVQNVHIRNIRGKIAVYSN